MAKPAKKKSRTSKKAARLTAKSKTSARSAAKTASRKPARKKAAARKIDPLNRNAYRSVTPMLAVSDLRRAISFYASVFGFETKALMDGPHGLIHAELTLRDTTLMLGPEEPSQNALSGNSIGNTPVTLYVLVEDADTVFTKAVAAGGRNLMPVMDMFWGDRCGVIADLDGNKWMIATHKSEPSEAEMAEALRRMMELAPAAAAAAGGL
jgi:uncharacterized glyoxalase superfamily protein PhnB